MQERKLELTMEFAKKRRAADEEGDTEESAKYAKRMAVLDAANVWPNGDATAQRFLAAMAVMWMGAILPVVFVTVALGAFGVMEFIRFVEWLLAKLKKGKTLAGQSA